MRLPLTSLLLLSLGTVGCGENSLLDRSLIFTTHTTFGIEVSANPAETGSPATLVIGYKRFEGVLNPVYHSDGVNVPAPNGPVERYRPQAYSVIAKFEGKATATGGGSEGALSLSQWFATGRAADYLARQGVAAALTDNAKVAEAVSRMSLLELSGEASEALRFSIINQLYTALTRLRDDCDAAVAAEANRLVMIFDSSPLVAQTPASIDVYDASHATQGQVSVYSITNKPSTLFGFARTKQFLADLSDSVDELKKLRNHIVNGKPVMKKGAASPALGAEKKDLLDAYDRQNTELEQWNEALRQDPAIREMLRSFAGVKESS